ncbi:hypothetical protein M1413_02540 [Patescibacteria group bacterium]|nr:hypothetical protein [Patescibacteria group bacterium]MCL5114702.1 hypothetical protein [Patescibacteria group bacterium]
MNKEEFSKLILSDPSEAWKKIRSGEIDISHVDFNVVKKRVENKFLTKEQIEAVESVYWASYLVEKEISDIISSTEKTLGNTDIVDAMLGRLAFGDKISLMDERYNKGGQIKPFISFAWRVNQLRNNVAHGRFGDLKYEGLDLSNRKGQFKFLIDLIGAFSKSVKNIRMTRGT